LCKEASPEEPVNILVTTPISDELLRQITNVSFRIEVSGVSELVRAEQKGDFGRKEALDVLLAEAEIIYGLRPPQNVIARAPKLKWVQAMSVGVDRFLDDEFRQSSVIMTSVSGMHATPIGEIILELMLMFAKQAPLCFQLKQERKWKRFAPAVLRSKTVGIVGFGNIGQEVARLTKAFGMMVVVTRRSAKRVMRAKYVDILIAPRTATAFA
jgi:phosphoglycerate dehydrogenase-like enzyme